MDMDEAGAMTESAIVGGECDCARSTGLHGEFEFAVPTPGRGLREQPHTRCEQRSLARQPELSFAFVEYVQEEAAEHSTRQALGIGEQAERDAIDALPIEVDFRGLQAGRVVACALLGQGRKKLQAVATRALPGRVCADERIDGVAELITRDQSAAAEVQGQASRTDVD